MVFITPNHVKICFTGSASVSEIYRFTSTICIKIVYINPKNALILTICLEDNIKHVHF